MISNKNYVPSLKHLVIISLSTFLLSSCSNTPKKLACSQLDWFELGRQDSGSGEMKQLDRRVNSCEGILEEKAKSEYLTGYDAGLIEFCSIENAWVIGKMGRAYKNICPKSQEKSFLSHYKKGLQLFSLEKKSANLALEMSSITERLRAKKIKASERFNLSSRLEQLRGERLRIIARMSQLENTMKF